MQAILVVFAIITFFILFIALMLVPSGIINSYLVGKHFKFVEALTPLLNLRIQGPLPTFKQRYFAPAFYANSWLGQAKNLDWNLALMAKYYVGPRRFVPPMTVLSVSSPKLSALAHALEQNKGGTTKLGTFVIDDKTVSYRLRGMITTTKKYNRLLQVIDIISSAANKL